MKDSQEKTKTNENEDYGGLENNKGNYAEKITAYKTSLMASTVATLTY